MKQLYFQAIKNIYKGEEITENYGPIFFYSSKDDRQNRLSKQYWFKCECVVRFLYKVHFRFKNLGSIIATHNWLIGQQIIVS